MAAPEREPRTIGAQEIAIVTPIFNDWESFAKLVAALDLEAAAWDVDIDVIAVDDGSTMPPQPNPGQIELRNIRNIFIVSLACNLGHQRAIAVGLVHANRFASYQAVIIMDSDGEDRPEDVGPLIEAWRERSNIIVAQRAERTETVLFKASYLLYKGLFRAFIGRRIDFGNFCLIPQPQLARLVHMGELWNHLAATIVRARIPFDKVRTRRGRRYAGRSSMSFVSLVVHGLSAAAVFSDVLFVRLLVAALWLSVMAGIVGVLAIVLRVLTDLAIPGWATTVVGLAGIVVVQGLTLCATATFMTLNTRSSLPFVPAIDALAFIRDVKRLERLCVQTTRMKA